MTTHIAATQPSYGPPDDLRLAAIRRLRRKRALQAHLLAYVTVNMFLTGIWLFSAPRAYYWPIFPLLGWGIGLAFHIWSVYSPTTPSEAHIQQEMQRLSRG